MQEGSASPQISRPAFREAHCCGLCLQDTVDCSGTPGCPGWLRSRDGAHRSPKNPLKVGESKLAQIKPRSHMNPVSSLVLTRKNWKRGANQSPLPEDGWWPCTLALRDQAAETREEQMWPYRAERRPQGCRRGDGVRKEPGLSVSLSAHQPQVSTYAESHAGQVKPFDQLNHRIYSNCIVIVPKEPGSNELDIIKILMPSFHS